MQFKYRAFIAYSHQDENWATWLHKALETYRVPARLVGKVTAAGPIPGRLSPIFRDRAELPSASDLSRMVNEALADSANLIVICSPRSAASHYVNDEISAFKRLGRAERIFCLIVDGEPNAGETAGREAEECFAPSLRAATGADSSPARERTAPIAADARPGHDGKTDVKLRIIAGLLGVGFDALKQREQQRRMRRMVAVTTLSLAAMLITTALAIVAVLARRTAVLERQAAERRQKQAENLVDFMLGDLSDKLRQVQRLDILEATDSQAMKYFQSLPIADVTDQALALRVKALQQIGSVRMSQGNIPAALESYRAASALAGEILGRAPADADRQVAYATSLNWVGNAYWYQGDLERALGNFRQSVELLAKVAAVRPQDSAAASDLASARTNAGRIFEARGDLKQAAELYESVRATFDALRNREPGNTRWQSELGFAYDNLGKVALEQGQLVQAIAAYVEDRRIKAALAAQDPKSNDAREDLLVADAILGRTLALCGADEAALRYVGDAVAIARELVAFDPTQTRWLEDLAYYGQLQGALLRESGRLQEASRLDRDAVRLLDDLVATDGTNTRWRRESAIAKLEAARAAVAQGEFGAADGLLLEASAAIRAGRETNPDEHTLILLAAEADILGGRITAKRSGEVAARDLWIRARDTIAPLAGSGKDPAGSGNDPNVLAAWASVLVLLNDLSAARPVMYQLSAMGYRTPDFDSLIASKRLRYAADPGVMRRINTELSQRP